MRLGSAFHPALEVWWNNVQSPDRLMLARHKLLVMFDKLELFQEQRIIAEMLLEAYDALYGDEAATYAEVKSEVRTTVPVYRPDGSVDPELELKVISDNEVVIDGERKGMEHKTTASDIDPGSAYWHRVEHSQQVDIYFIVAHDSGSAMKEVVYDVVRAPNLRRMKATPVDKRQFYVKDCKYGKAGSPRPGTRLTEESWDEFRARIEEDLLANPTRYFRRVRIEPDETRLDKTRLDVWAAGRQMLAAVLEGAFPRNRNGCSAYGRPCEYTPICWEGHDPVGSPLYSIRKPPPVLEDIP